MSLKAVDLNLGSLIVCDIWCVDKAIRKILNIQKEIVALFLLGYSNDTPNKKILKSKDIIDLRKK